MLIWNESVSRGEVVTPTVPRVSEPLHSKLLGLLQKEKNLILALKNTTLQQEVEDLQFQARNRLAMSR